MPNNLTPINDLLRIFEEIVKGNDITALQKLTLADAQLIRVYLYDLKLRMIKERDNVK
jgi:hypothetical protein